MIPNTSSGFTCRLTFWSAQNSSWLIWRWSIRMAYSLKVRIRSRGTRYLTETPSRRMTGSTGSFAPAAACSGTLGSDAVSKLVGLSGEVPPANHQCAERDQHGDGGDTQVR